MVDTSPLQLVDAEGTFNKEGIQDFCKSSGLSYAGLQYQIIAIMGPQSSGKSTLLNHLFGTNFIEMDALRGRRQTTQGIWVSKSPKLEDLATYILDLEGTDGRERGDDDTNFERQSSLFALAISDVVMINIWCHDVGREHGAGKPLIKTVLQVNLKLFTPNQDSKKTVLVFVIRDKSKTPLSKLAEVLEQDLIKIWVSMEKPPQYAETDIHDFFDVYFESLPNFEEKEEDFKSEVYLLRKKFTLEENNSYVRLSGKLPGDAIALSTEKVWEVIKTHKDLDLPAHKIMVANTRCAQILQDQYEGLINDKLWEELIKEANEGFVSDFGQRASSLVEACILGYDDDALYFDATIRAEKRQELIDKIVVLIKNIYEKQIKFLHELLMKEFENTVSIETTVKQRGFTESVGENKKLNINRFSEDGEKLSVKETPYTHEDYKSEFEKDIDKLIQKWKDEKIAEGLSGVDKAFMTILSIPVSDLFISLPGDLWKNIRSLIDSSLKAAERKLNDDFEGYEFEEEEEEYIKKSVYKQAMILVERHAKEASHTALSRMKDKFNDVFTLDENKVPRTWSPKDDISKIAYDSRIFGARILSQLTINESEQLPDIVNKIEKWIKDMAMSDLRGDEVNDDGEEADSESVKIEGLVEWPDVVLEKVLLSPQEVRSLWRRFVSDTKMQITQASLTQQANRMASNRMPPVWALILLVILGFNEFTAVLYSPFLAIFLAVVILFARTLYIEMDVDAEMQKGALPGTLALAAKFVPSVQSVSQRTFDSLGQFLNTSENTDNNDVTHNALRNDDFGRVSFKDTMRNPSSDGLHQRTNNGNHEIELSNSVISGEMEESEKDK